MKVLHINCNYITTALHQLMIEELDSYDNIENSVFVPTYDKNLSIIAPNDNVMVSECFEKRDRLVYLYKQNKILTSVNKYLLGRSVDIVHAYTLFTDGNIAYSLYKSKGIPYVVAIRDTDINDFLRLRPYLLNRGIEIMRNAKKVYFLSPSYQRLMFAKIKKSPYLEEIQRKSIVRTNGVNNFWLINAPGGAKPFSIEQKSISIICVAQIIKRKNIPVVQEAVKLLKIEGWNAKLKIIGKSVDKHLLEIIKKDQNTEYIDAIPKEQLKEHYDAADIFVLASKTETFGLVYAEAMSCGLPVVYTRGQGFDGHFEEGQVGYSVDCNSPLEIKDKILKIIGNYDTISQTCLVEAKRFSWQHICKEYLCDYLSILRG